MVYLDSEVVHTPDFRRQDQRRLLPRVLVRASNNVWLFSGFHDYTSQNNASSSTIGSILHQLQIFKSLRIFFILNTLKNL